MSFWEYLLANPAVLAAVIGAIGGITAALIKLVSILIERKKKSEDATDRRRRHGKS